MHKNTLDLWLIWTWLDLQIQNVLFSHTFETRRVLCLLWGLYIDFEIFNYTLALIPVWPLLSSALPNSSAQMTVHQPPIFSSTIPHYSLV